MYVLLRVLPVCLSFLQTGAQDDQFAPISLDDRIQHFSGVSQTNFQGVPRPPPTQQFQPQQAQFQSQTQQFRPQQENFQPQQLQNFQPQVQQNFQPQQQRNFQPQQQQNFQPQQQQNFQPQQQQFQEQQQQFQSQQQQFQPQQQQPLSTEALQESLKQSLQKSLQQQIQKFQQPKRVQEFPQGADVPQTDFRGQTPEHIRQFQQDVKASQQPKHPFTVFGNPSEPAETQFRKPSTEQFQQQQGQFQQQQPNNFQQQQSILFQQQQSNTFQQPSQSPPFTAFSQNQQVAPNGQQSSRSFQNQGQQQFAPELPRSSQQFQSRPQIGAFDQIKSAINNGRHFSPQQVQFPQRQQPIAQLPTTTQPPPKFMPLNAVPPGSEQIGTHKKLEDTVKNQKSVNKQEPEDKIINMERIKAESLKNAMKVKQEKKTTDLEESMGRKNEESSKDGKQEKKTPDLESFIKKVVVQTIAGKKTQEEENKDQIETAAVVEELNNILELLSKPSSIRNNSNKIASIKKSKTKPETSLIRIQENLLGLSGPNREEESKSSTASGDINELLNLLSKSTKKIKKPSKSSASSLQEKILKLSGREKESEDLLTTINKNKSLEEDIENEDDDLSAVQEALSKLLGSKPEEDSKISPEVFSVVLQLDDFFKEEEKQKSKKINEVESLVDTALGFIDGAVTRREHAEKRLIEGEPVFDYDDYYGELLDSLDLSPSELRKLLTS